MMDVVNKIKNNAVDVRKGIWESKDGKLTDAYFILDNKNQLLVTDKDGVLITLFPNAKGNNQYLKAKPLIKE